MTYLKIFKISTFSKSFENAKKYRNILAKLKNNSGLEKLIFRRNKINVARALSYLKAHLISYHNSCTPPNLFPILCMSLLEVLFLVREIVFSFCKIDWKYTEIQNFGMIQNFKNLLRASQQSKEPEHFCLLEPSILL